VVADLHRQAKPLPGPRQLINGASRGKHKGFPGCVDPERDDPAQITDYLGNFDAGFTGVTGPRDAMEPWLSALGVSVHMQRQPGGESYTVTHNSTIYVVGPGTELVAVFSAPHDAGIIAADFLKIRQHYLNDPPRPSEPSNP